MAEKRHTAPQQLDQDSGRALFDAVRRERLRSGDVLSLDFAATNKVDTCGAAWLVEAAQYARKQGATLRMTGQKGAVAEFLTLMGPAIESPPPSPPPRAGLFERIGGTAYDIGRELRDFMNLCVDAIYWSLLAPFEGRGFRWNNFFDEVYEMGVRAVGIVCLMNFLLGLIIAMLMAKQAEIYGMQIFVADLVMIGFARELAAIMTAVVVSARTGAAIAAEIATMQVQEEIDALRGMGLNVAQFLVAPKILALLLVLPCLVVLGMISGIAGGALWGTAVLDFTWSVWLNETQNAAYVEDFVQGMSKTFVFAIGIVLIGCHNGFRVRGGSRGVGLMTTRAVVMDIFMLICVDIVFATLFYYVFP